MDWSKVFPSPSDLPFLRDAPTTVILYVFLAALAVAVLGRAARRRGDDEIVARPLLTGNETEFLARLRRALPDHHVFPQVAMSAVLTSRTRRGRFDRKVVDYVVCDARMSMVALVELDDRTHSRKRDRERDRLTARAGHVTLRYGSRAKPGPDRIAADVAKAAKARRS